ncbi:FadR/GntR family transcriptional regulator [Cryobacterium tagatosivorans]|uniref:FadR family transcriptional regulator n=1 Tax=Cryobacterium tagatosivorans TaxID=1259199 RepID=A0A4R8UG57_9MICO|nr:FCD domain-containing protein [Cryobacterium tagatosivorans]TFB52454.1 FadR family transcriptional regulator [Cryobacterium tagatosivorans]
MLPPALSAGAVGTIRRTSAVDTVRARISLAADLGLLSPGERLPTASDMAAGLEVSEITVRRALTELQRAGVVERSRGRGGGTYLAKNPTRDAVPQTAAYRADADRVRQLIDERSVLEAGLAHLACEHRTEADLAAMDAAIGEMAAAESWASFRRGDEAFHLRVASAAGLSNVLPLYRRTLADLHSYFLPYPIAYLHESNEEHRVIRDAIAARDRVAAADAVMMHVADLHHSMYIGLNGPE